MKTKLTILGDGWSGRLLADALKRRDQECELWLSETPVPPPDTTPVYLGTGDTAETARKIFGEPLFSMVWGLSSENHQLARARLSGLGVAFREGGVLRAGGTKDVGLSFSARALETALDSKPVAGRFREIESLSALGNLEFGARLNTAQGPVDLRSPLIVVATESFSLGAIPWLSDKRIPVTLSSFHVDKAALSVPPTESVVHFFNGGAEAAVLGESGGRFISYRNLWSDRGVGLKDEIDPVTESNLRNFFSQQGWFPPSVSLRGELSIESVTCDGLPILGPLPGHSGIVFALGFGARTACLFFAVAEILADALTGGTSEKLDRFSTRRLI